MKKLQLFDQNHGLSETDVSDVFGIKRDVNKISSRLLKFFFSDTISTKYSAREGDQEREGGGEERKENE